MKDLSFYNSYLEVDMGTVAHAFERVKKHLEPNMGIIPVIKGNAYGFGTEAMARFFSSRCPDMMACSQVCEGSELRQNGIEQEIMLLTGVPENALDKAIKLDLQVPVFNNEGALCLSRHAKKLGKKVKCQLKTETGFGAIGARPGDELKSLLNTISALDNIEIDGIFTHFSTATEVNSEYTLQQLDLFAKAVAQLKSAGVSPRFIHCRNTGAASWLREDLSTHIRAATLLLGYAGMDDGSNILGFTKEPLSWRAFVTNVTTLYPGESCGYSRTFVAQKPTKVAMLGIGYGDGLLRSLANEGGPVLIGDKRAKYITCSMDQAFVDVTDIPCNIGDEATVFGYSKGGTPLTLGELELIAGHTMTYLQTLVSPRVKRVYINEEEY